MGLYIGLMSGTSVDSVDIALCDITDQDIHLIEAHSFCIPKHLQDSIHALSQSNYSIDAIDLLGQVDQQIGTLMAQAVIELLTTHNLTAKDIVAIGSHGQTIRHRPNDASPFTIQIGDPNCIAGLTGITTVADFRRKDIALGGQGAPLVPAFHKAIFAHPVTTRIIVNLGGIANITVIDGIKPVIGYDTGPANTLIDQWIKKHHNVPFDDNGLWAKQGTINNHLLQQLSTDDYFSLPYPKSTGREYFNLAWLEKYLSEHHSPVDVQRTLVELTASTVTQAILQHSSQGEVFVCGGGAHNSFLLERMSTMLPDCTIKSTVALGVEPDWVEAMAFAWLAKQTLSGMNGSLKSVTGASRDAVLGAIYPP